MLNVFICSYHFFLNNIINYLFSCTCSIIRFNCCLFTFGKQNLEKKIAKKSVEKNKECWIGNEESITLKKILFTIFIFKINQFNKKKTNVHFQVQRNKKKSGKSLANRHKRFKNNFQSLAMDFNEQ